MRYKLFLMVFCLPFMQLAYAEPSILVFDPSVKKSRSAKKIRSVHQEIVTASADINKTRNAILKGMLQTHGFAWVFEGEGDGYILARFDYRGNTNVIKIEYNEKLIQLKYHQALEDFVCEKLIDGICYKNSSGYYKYFRNLRLSIEKQVKFSR